jgi:hypothetical protein
MREESQMKRCPRLTVLFSVLVLAILSGAGSASAWAPEGSATIHPGVMTFTGGSSFLNGAGQCTANFVYTDASGSTYLGQAAHCSSTGGSTETNGCSTKSLPLGTPIYAGDLVNGGVQNGTLIGTLAYNSWIAMQQAKETNAATCAYNDLALIKISAAQVSPGIPGDSGSAYMNAAGNALGVLSTVEFAPVPASNGVGTLAKELAYANTATGLGIKVAPGTTAFSAVPVPPAP